GDPDDQVAGPNDRVAVAVLGGDVHLDRHPRPLLDRVTADQAGVVGGATGDDHDPPQVAHLVVLEADAGEVDPVVAGQAVGKRLGDRVGLFVDLLQHEGLIAALLGRVGIPADLFGLALDRGPRGVGDPHPAGF